MIASDPSYSHTVLVTDLNKKALHLPIALHVYSLKKICAPKFSNSKKFLLFSLNILLVNVYLQHDFLSMYTPAPHHILSCHVTYIDT